MSASENDKGYQALLATFRGELNKLGWEEGRNLRMDYRWKALDAESRQRLAKELIALQPDLMLAQSTPTTAVLLRKRPPSRSSSLVLATRSAKGSSRACSRPGGNVTGFINMEASMSGKWLELLQEITPGLKRVVILFNPATAPGGGSYYLDPFNTAVQSSGIQSIAAPVHDTSEIESVIAAQARKPNSGLVVMSDVFPLVHRTEIAALAARYRLPAVYPYRQFVEVGGLLSYGNDLSDNYRRAATSTVTFCAVSSRAIFLSRYR